MKSLTCLISLFFTFSIYADDAFDRFVDATLSSDIETFSESYRDEKIKVIETSTRVSINPLQWLLMIKDLASGETRRVMTFKYKVEGSAEIKKGFLVMTYEKQKELSDENEDCYRFDINKMIFDTSIFNISGTVPGFRTVRTIEQCLNE